MTFLQRTGQSPKGAVEFLRILQREERMQISQRDPYLSTHPLTPDRIAAFEEAAARSPYVNKPDSPEFLEMHHRMVAKLMGFITPDVALQHFTEADRSVPARYARAIAWYRKGALGSALLTIDGLLKEYPERSLLPRGARPDAVRERPRRRGRRLLPPCRAAPAQRRHHQGRFCARPARQPTIPRTTARPSATSSWPRSRRSGTFDLWRLMAAGYSRLNNPGMTSLARAEMAMLRGQRAEAQAHADAATHQLQPNTPAWQRAQDIKAYINTRAGRR